jgi:dCMP deaminase
MAVVDMLSKWDLRYLDLAKYVSCWSKDPSTKVGAVIVDQYNSIVSLGFNGFPRGVFDSEERLDNRELKYKMVVHAEVNALAFAQRDVHGCTLYTTPFMPCSVCTGQIIQRGITRVVTYLDNNPRWVESFKLSRIMFEEAGVRLDEFDEQFALKPIPKVHEIDAKIKHVRELASQNSNDPDKVEGWMKQYNAEWKNIS